MLNIVELTHPVLLLALITRKFSPFSKSKHLQLSGIRVLNRAKTPLRPFRPDVMMNFIMGAMISIVGGIAFCFVSELFDGTVRNPEEVESTHRILLSRNYFTLIRRKNA